MPRPEVICRNHETCLKRKYCRHAKKHEDSYTDCWPDHQCPGCRKVEGKDTPLFKPYKKPQRHQSFVDGTGVT